MRGAENHRAPEAHGVRLDRKRVYILPTRHGYAFALALLVMLLGAINYDNSLAYMLSFLLGGVGLVSLLHTYRNLVGLSLHAGNPLPVFANREAEVPIGFENLHGPARHALLLEHPRALPAAASPGRGRWLDRVRRLRRTRREPAAPSAVAVTALEPDSRRRITVPVRLSRRGLVTVRGLRIATRFPLGLFRAWSPLGFAPRCLVYPEPRGEARLPAPRDTEHREEGRSSIGQDDFSGLRSYQPGDSPKRIHWKAVARGRGVPIKLFEGGGSKELVLGWPHTDALGDTEARLSQLCLWVLEAERSAQRYALELPGKLIEAGLGEQHRDTCLAALALYGHAGQNDQPEEAARAGGAQPARGATMAGATGTMAG